MVQQLTEIIDSANKHEKDFSKTFDKVHPKYLASAKNLVHYRSLRSFDLTRLQERLGNLGLSRLARMESHVMASLITSRELVNRLMENKVKGVTPELSIKKSIQRQRRNVVSLLGKRPEKRRTHIMVTLPSETALNSKLLQEMLKSGMTCARINCAHDNARVWKAMAKNIRDASKVTGKPCQISMDLGGPKIRTGLIESGPKVIKFRPFKNKRGEIIYGKEILLGTKNKAEFENFLPVTKNMKMKIGKILYCIDSRGKMRKLKIVKCNKGGCLIELNRTTYFETGMHLYKDREMLEFAAQVGELPAIVGSIFLVTGDMLILRKDRILAKNRGPKMQKTEKTVPEISCSNPQVFKMVKEGEKVIFDDGKIEGIIKKVKSDQLAIQITLTRSEGTRLRADKGINFPDSKLTIRGLTAKDKADLKTVVKLADIVNMSFVNSVKDVRDIVNAMHALPGGDKLGLILKIETLSGYENLTEIILAGMQNFPIGVMIARGDLALEIGWDHIAVVQKEIMQICHAAHLPDIWATQVFETLAKTGVPSRAEITDATIGQRAECVMLNKGPYIVNAISLLDTILSILDAYQDKSSKFLPAYKK